MAKFHSNDVSGEEKWTFFEIYTQLRYYTSENNKIRKEVKIYELYWYITWGKRETADFIFKDFGGETDVRPTPGAFSLTQLERGF
jgi:hypothetical protein